jgi:hypothetical protein
MKKIELYVSDEDAAFFEELLGRLGGVSYSILEVETQSSAPSPMPKKEQEALIEAVQESEEDIAEGRVFSTEEIENEIAQWRKHTP